MKKLIAIVAVVAFTISFAPVFGSYVNTVNETIVVDKDPKAKKSETKEEKKEAKKECSEEKKCCSGKKTEPKN